MVCRQYVLFLFRNRNHWRPHGAPAPPPLPPPPEPQFFFSFRLGPIHTERLRFYIWVCDCFPWCLPLLTVSSPIKINGIHLVADAITVTDSNASVQREWILKIANKFCENIPCGRYIGTTPGGVLDPPLRIVRLRNHSRTGVSGWVRPRNFDWPSTK